MNYKKHGIAFLIKDFFSTSKTQIFFSCLLFLSGLILAVIFFVAPEMQKGINVGKIIGKMILIIVPCYVLSLLSTIFKYAVIFFFAGFCYLGYFAGRIAKAVYSIQNFLGIIQFLLIYIPAFFVTIILLNALINLLSPHISFSCNSKISTMCKNSFVTIIKYVLVVFAINIVFFTLWFLIFAKIFRLCVF